MSTAPGSSEIINLLDYSETLLFVEIAVECVREFAINAHYNRNELRH